MQIVVNNIFCLCFFDFYFLSWNSVPYCLHLIFRLPFSPRSWIHFKHFIQFWLKWTSTWDCVNLPILLHLPNLPFFPDRFYCQQESSRLSLPSACTDHTIAQPHFWRMIISIDRRLRRHRDNLWNMWKRWTCTSTVQQCPKYRAWPACC